MSEPTIDRPAPGIAVIHTPENFDQHTARPVAKMCENLIKQDSVHVFVFDLSATRYGADECLKALVYTRARLRQHNGIVVVDTPTPSFYHLLTVESFGDGLQIINCADGKRAVELGYRIGQAAGFGERQPAEIEQLIAAWPDVEGLDHGQRQYLYQEIAKISHTSQRLADRYVEQGY